MNYRIIIEAEHDERTGITWLEVPGFSDAENAFLWNCMTPAMQDKVRDMINKAPSASDIPGFLKRQAG